MHSAALPVIITGLPAQTLGVADRGVIKVGAVADITVFDAETILDCSTFMDSVQKPEGIEYVIVAGEIALQGGVSTGSKTGGVLLKN